MRLNINFDPMAIYFIPYDEESFLLENEEVSIEVKAESIVLLLDQYAKEQKKTNGVIFFDEVYLKDGVDNSYRIKAKAITYYKEDLDMYPRLWCDELDSIEEIII